MCEVRTRKRNGSGRVIVLRWNDDHQFLHTHKIHTLDTSLTDMCVHGCQRGKLCYLQGQPSTLIRAVLSPRPNTLIRAVLSPRPNTLITAVLSPRPNTLIRAVLSPRPTEHTDQGCPISKAKYTDQDFKTIFVLRGEENLLAVTRMTNTNIHTHTKSN